MSGVHRASTSSRTVARRSTAVAFTLIGVVCLLLWRNTSDSIPSAIDAGSASTQTAVSDLPVDPDPSAPAADALPVRLSIPDLGLHTRLLGLGLQPDGTVEVPDDPARAGWYRLGPPPGAAGSAVILGHVDSVDGPAVFAHLAELTRGDRIVVTTTTGSDVRFVVRTVTTYANADFPAQRVYGFHGRRELNLVTCGGTYDATRGGYQANVVVNARRIGHPRVV